VKIAQHAQSIVCSLVISLAAIKSVIVATEATWAVSILTICMLGLRHRMAKTAYSVGAALNKNYAQMIFVSSVKGLRIMSAIKKSLRSSVSQYPL